MNNLTTRLRYNSTNILQRELDTTLQILLYSFIGILALPGNFIIVYMAIVPKKLTIEALGLLQNLAVSDIFIIFVGVPLTIANLASDGGAVTKDWLCQTQGFVILALFLNSNFNITFIAIHRYLYIVKKTYYEKITGKGKYLYPIILTWVIAIIVSIPSVTDWGKQDYNFNRAHCMIVWGHSISYLVFVQALAFFVPLLIIVFCYWNILKHFRSSQKRTNNRTSERTPCMISVMISVSFFVSFLPYAVLIIYEGEFKETAGEIYSFIAMASAYSNGICDFWIYSYMNRNFRRAGKSLLCCSRSSFSKIQPTVDRVNLPHNQEGTSKSIGTEFSAEESL